MKSTAKIFVTLVMVAIIAVMFVAAIMGKDKIVTSNMSITSIADLYDDETRAREDLEAMYDAGLIDGSGKLADLNLRENGKSVELSALAERIAKGEEVGNITVNGRAATAEQVVKIAQVNAAIEIAELLNEEIDVTDEHVKNLEAFITNIQNGKVDLGNAIKTGSLLLGSDSNDGASDGNEKITGNLTLSNNGKNYLGSYVSWDSYQQNYEFALTDPSFTTWYADSDSLSAFDVAGGLGEITIKSGPTPASFLGDDYDADNHFVVTASLDRPMSVPVSVDCVMSGRGWYNLNGKDQHWSDAYSVTTFTWEPGEYGDKDIGLWMDLFQGGNHGFEWEGGMVYTYSVVNPKNATIKGSSTNTWNTKVTLQSGPGYNFVKEGQTTSTTAEGFHVPAGVYYVGQVVPVYVRFANPVCAGSNTTMTINNVVCPVMEGTDYACKTLIFGYTLRESDVGSLTISSLDHVKVNKNDQGEMTINNFSETTIGEADDVFFASAAKTSSVNISSAKCGVDDGAEGLQVATVVIPVTGSNKNWLASETAPMSEPLLMKLPGYSGTQSVENYLTSGYFSLDGGKTRYPAYVLGDGSAIVARYTVPPLKSAQVRRDGVGFYLFPALLGASNAERFIGAFSSLQKDYNGYYYFTAEENARKAPLFNCGAFNYFVKGAVLFDNTQYVTRTQEYTVADNGFIKLSDGKYVLLKDKDNPQNQYDVEAVVGESIYTAVVNGTMCIEEAVDASVSYQLSSRKSKYSFADIKWFGWSSTDDNAVMVVTNNGDPSDAEAMFTGSVSNQPVTLTLKVGNGPTLGDTNDNGYTIDVCSFRVTAGLYPYLTIPKSSRYRTTFTNTATDIFFASNIPDHNKLVGHNNEPVEGELYRVDAVGDPVSDRIASFYDSNSPGNFTVYGEELREPGVYAVVLHLIYYGNEVATRDFYSEIAYITVKQGPAKVAFDKLASYAVVMDETDPQITLNYTLTSALDGAEVKYTIQASGSDEILRETASGGSISFTPSVNGLKDAYTITIYARNNEGDPWSVDSMLLTVYNANPLKLLMSDVAYGTVGGSTGGTAGDGTVELGSTYTMDNRDKIIELLDESGYVVTFDDLDALRGDITLQRVISANYGSGAWGAISDKLQWSATDKDGNESDDLTLNYKEEGGYYWDIRNYNYVYYTPTTDFLLVGTDNDTVTVSAVHAKTGLKTSVDVTVNTLKDKLYMFRFLPKATTNVTYTTYDENGNPVVRKLQTNDRGELIVYEPYGIKTDVVTTAVKGSETYVGTIRNGNLVSGEKNVVKLQVYPCNFLSLVPISSTTLTFLTPDGKPYNGKVILRAGVYADDEYAPSAGIRTSGDASATQYLREDAVVTAVNGKATVWFDPTQFGTTDNLRYVFEYRFENSYQPGYVIVNPNGGNPNERVVTLRAVAGNMASPAIVMQNLQQYFDNAKTAYMRSVLDYSDNIGISKRFAKAVLYTDLAFPGEAVVEGEKIGASNGYSIYSGNRSMSITLYTIGGVKLTGQTQLDSANPQAKQILKFSDLNDETTLFVFPFSSMPMLRNTYTMTDATLEADGITDVGPNIMPTVRIKAVVALGGRTIKSVNLPFGVSNLSHQKDISQPGNGAKEIGEEVRNELMQQTDIGEIFRTVNVNEMIRQGFVFLGNLNGVGGDNPIDLMILPTEDPSVFRIVAFVGKNAREGDDDDGDGISVNYNKDDLYEDMEKFQKELEESTKKKKDDDDGDGSMEFNFYGTIVLEARIGSTDGDWDISFRGGNVGTNVKGKYEWGQTFMCGPYPAFISFETGFHADLEVAFGNKGSARAMLLDAALGVSIEAFAGLGFDMSIVAIQLGIYGSIGADVNFLLLTPSDGAVSTGTQLTIAGEIGIKLKVKLLFISYSQTFASTGFNWTKKWNKYDQIQNYWNDQGYGEMFGVTRKGRKYSMLLFADGSAMVAIEGGAELESRDYLELEQRVWSSGASGARLRKAAGSLTDVQTNAYPYSNPVFTDDGEMFLYVSDNNNADKVESVASFAVKDGDGYVDMGRIDPSADNILADLDVVASGNKNNAFAAWVKQIEMPKKETIAEPLRDDFGMMLNATEVYAAAFDGTAWTTTRLTDNYIGDMSPVVASSDNRAIVAWRSMNASSMTAGDDITATFDLENNINYRVYNGTEWTSASVAYNGNAGSVNALDAAMLSDGTAIVTYSVRTGEDVSTTETFYTVVGADGNVLTTGRLTNDNYTDTNAKATAVNEDGGYFVIGWYSEHDSGEGSTVEYDSAGKASQKAVVAHDIRLARINANGSYALDFPESIGGNGNAGVGSNFRFSAPAGNEDLTNVSIVWSERKDSDLAADAGKYQLNAVRFFKAGKLIGVTAPTNMAETAKNYTIDHFDVYTDSEGAVHAVILGSDYNNIQGIEVYDSIDLDAAAGNSVETNTDAPSNLDILGGEAISSIKLAKGTFPALSLDAIAETNIDEVIPGLSTSVQFSLSNTGSEVIDSVTVTIGSDSKEFVLNLLPNQSTTLMMTYDVPEGAVSDVAYSIASNGVELSTGTLTLNLPDVGVASVKLLREENGERDVLVRLSNDGNVPLAGSGKTVKLAFYKDPFYQNVIGEEIVLSQAEYANIDQGEFTILHTIAVADLYKGDGEIPDGVTLYIRAWVADAEEPNVHNNIGYIAISSLLARNNGKRIVEETTLDVGGDGSYTVYADIRNNSMKTVDVGIPVAVLFDGEGKMIAHKNLLETELALGKEERRVDMTATFTAAEVEGTPVQAEIRHIVRVSFDVVDGTGEFESRLTDVYGHLTLPDGKPTPPQNDPALFFRGWYSIETGLELVTEDYVFNANSTVYAQYTPHRHVFSGEVDGATLVATCVEDSDDGCLLPDHTATLTIVAPERAADGYGIPTATILGDPTPFVKVEVKYFTANADGSRGEALSEAPIQPGRYRADIDIGEDYGAEFAHVVYEIPAIEGANYRYVSVPNFVKATDPAELENMTPCTAYEALAWWYTNEASLARSSDADKYIIFQKGYLPCPDDKSYWPFDQNSEYVIGYQHTRNGFTYAQIKVSQAIEWIANGSSEFYFVGEGTTQVLANVEFKQISTQEELASFTPSTELEAVLWAMENLDDTTDHIIICYNDYPVLRSIKIDSYRAKWYLNPIVWSTESSGKPVYVAVPHLEDDPYKTYYVCYDANGGSGTTAGEYFYRRSHIELASGDGLSHHGLVFNGWNTKADGTGDAYQPGDTFEVLGDTVFYAQWKHVHQWKVNYYESLHEVHAKCEITQQCDVLFLIMKVGVKDKVYDGKKPQVYTLPEEWTEANGLPLPVVTYRMGGEVVDEAVNVGTYTATITIGESVFDLGEFTISPRPIVVTADDQEIYERQEEPELTVSYEGVGTTLYFENDENYPWQIANDDGHVYVKSGNAGKNNTTSTLTLKVTLEKAGTLSFEYYYDTERWGSDKCYFHVDGTEVFCVYGEGSWQTYSIDLAEGNHTVTWAYSKNYDGTQFGDFFAISNVAIASEGAVKEWKILQPEGSELIPGLHDSLYFNNDEYYSWEEETEGDRVYFKQGGWYGVTSTLSLFVTLEKAGTVAFDYKYITDYYDNCYFTIDDQECLYVYGNEQPYWQRYSCDIGAGSHTLKWIYSMDDEEADGEIFAIDNFVITTEGTVTQMKAAPYSPAGFDYAATHMGGIVEGETLNYTISRQAGTTKGTYAITLTMGDNPNYDIKKVQNGTFTILESLGEPQVIEASDVTATYGDAGVKINATVTTGDGTLSYKVKSGDAVTVDAEGNLTIVKAGTAVIVVTASQTDTYAITDKKINVTINPKNMTVSADNVNDLVDGQNHGITVTVTDPQEGYTVKYGTEEGTYDLVSSPYLTDEGTLVVCYQVTADNYVTFTGSATITLISHSHVLTYTQGTGDNANTIIATCSADNCYFQGSKATLSISVPGTDIVYDGKSHPAIITDAHGIMGNVKVLYATMDTDGIYGTPSETVPVNVGTYKASITLGSGENSATVSVEYEITNATLTNVGVAQKGTLVYNGDAQTPQVTTSATAVNNQTVTFVYSLTENGEYGEMPSFTLVADSGTVYFKANADNHDEATGSFIVTVNKANQVAPIAPILDTATANMIKLMAEYGCEYSINGTTWQDSVVFTGLTKNTEYTFYQRLKETANYNASPLSEAAIISTEDHNHEWNNFSGNGAVITAICDNTDGGHSGEISATITITAPTLTIYGGTGSAEATVINNIDGIDTPIIVYKQGDTVLSAAPTDAGTYTASITLDGATASVTYTIAKKAASVTAANKFKTYGEDDPELTATALGTVGEDTINYTLSRAEGENAGEHIITVILGENPNYDVTVTNANLTIVKKAANVTPADKSKTYGEDDPELTATVLGLVGEDTLNYTLSRTVGENVGEYVISVTLGNNPNYDVTITGTATYTINKKAVTLNLYVDGVIVTEATSIIYDGQEHTFVVKAIGANDEVITIGAETLTDVFSSTEFIVYAQNLAADGSEYENYVLDNDYNVPDYAIAAKAITITADDKSSVYGESIVGLTAQITDGNGVYVLPDEDSDVFVLTKEQGVNAGEYVITVNVVGNSNYIVTPVNGIYTINQKAVTVTPDNKIITYGDDNVALTYAITGLVGEETLTGVTLTREEGTDAGTYAITATHDDTLDLNYAITIAVTGAYTIQKKVNTINTDGIVKEYTYSGSNVTVDGATALGDGEISYENNVVKEAGKHTVVVKVTEGTNYLAAETTIDVFVKETAPVLNDESGTNTHGKIISVENAQAGTSMTEIFKNAKEDETESKEISATIDTANIVFNEAAIEEISTAGEVELKFSVIYVDESEPIETAALQDAEVIIKVSLSDGITFASGKATITIDLKKEVPDKKIVKVYYVDADGNRTDMNATYADGKVTFETNHFSDYIVVFEKKGLSGGAIAGIVIGCFFGLLILAFVILFLLYSRDKNKDDDKKLIKVPFINNMMSKVDAFVSNIGKKKDVSAKAQDKTTENETADANETTGVVAPQDTCVDAAEDEEDGVVVVDAKGNYFNIRYNKSFTAKLIQSSDETKEYYGELKNEALSYNKTKSRVSWSYDSINSGRAPVVKFGIRGKTLCVYFPLNAEELDDKYKVETVEAAKYEAVPCMYRIKNERRLRYAKELIAKVCEALGLTKGDDQHEDYYLSYESTEVLIAKGLIKELKTQLGNAVEIGQKSVHPVSVREADRAMSDEVAATFIQDDVDSKVHEGKKGIINIDVIGKAFNDGDTVDIEALWEKKLIPLNVGYVKVLARGALDKKLNVDLQDYSIQAVKMIALKGGTVKKAR